MLLLSYHLLSLLILILIYSITHHSSSNIPLTSSLIPISINPSPITYYYTHISSLILIPVSSSHSISLDTLSTLITHLSILLNHLYTTSHSVSHHIYLLTPNAITLYVNISTYHFHIIFLIMHSSHVISLILLITHDAFTLIPMDNPFIILTYLSIIINSVPHFSVFYSLKSYYSIIIIIM